MELKGLFGGHQQQQPVTGYRFGDFTPEELRLTGVSLLEMVRLVTETIERLPVSARSRPAAIRRKEVLSRLYKECEAAHRQAVIDEENNGEGWRL